MLHACYIFASGHRLHLTLEGDAGRVGAVLPIHGGHPPQNDPCPTCSDRARCEVEGFGIDGCDTAMGWARAAREYERLTTPGQQKSSKTTDGGDS